MSKPLGGTISRIRRPLQRQLRRAGDDLLVDAFSLIAAEITLSR
jgi:hypothetical protein